MARIVINGKFLGAGLNGVHRTAAHYATHLIAQGKAAGHDVTLLSPRPFADPLFPLLVPEICKGFFGSGQGWEMLTLPRAAKDALLVSFCNLGPILHKNAVVMIHDAQTFLYPEDYTGRQATAYRALLPRIAQRARRVLTVSEFSRRSLADFKIGHKDQISVVHNGTDHLSQTKADPSIFQAHNIVPKRYVMTLGSTKSYKNIARLFDVFSQGNVAGLSLVVAGGPGKAAYIESGIRPPDGTIFTGFVSDAALRALYENAAIFAFPSLTEGFGLPPVEAMHSGVPVVIANAGALPEVCEDGAIAVDPHDSQPWKAAMERIQSDAAFQDALIARGIKRAGQLTWDNAGKTLWSHIDPLLKGPS